MTQTELRILNYVWEDILEAQIKMKNEPQLAKLYIRKARAGIESIMSDYKEANQSAYPDREFYKIKELQ